jgi:uncharacterized protein (TIGR03792 family)
MTIERLRYHVPETSRDVFLKADDAIWTAVLSQQAGFVSKQTWLSPDAPDELDLVIQWQSREHWKTIPEALLLETNAAFVKKVGAMFTLLEVLEYEVL